MRAARERVADVAIVDGVFLLRPELAAVEIVRDAARMGGADAARGRYARRSVPGETINLEGVDPQSLADIVVARRPTRYAHASSSHVPHQVRDVSVSAASRTRCLTWLFEPRHMPGTGRVLPGAHVPPILQAMRFRHRQVPAGRVSNTPVWCQARDVALPALSAPPEAGPAIWRRS